MADDAQRPQEGRAGFAGRAMRPPMPAWPLTVLEAFDVTPRMRRVRFAGAAGEMNWQPGQDLVLTLPTLPAGDETARRHYTIRSATKDALDIDFVLHGDSPATRWARNAKAGAAITAQGPRGRTRLHDARHHWFIGDETALPGIFAMAEALRPDAQATILLEIGAEADKQELKTAAQVNLQWIIRNAPAAPNDLLLDALKAHAPEAAGAHAYLLGETSKVRALRHYLSERGFAREQFVAEGYWRPGRIGGHDHA